MIINYNICYNYYNVSAFILLLTQRRCFSFDIYCYCNNYLNFYNWLVVEKVIDTQLTHEFLQHIFKLKMKLDIIFGNKCFMLLY